MTDAATRQVPVELVQFLVVDDHGFVRHIVGECLKANKIKRFTFAQDGGEAMHFLTLLSSKSGDSSLVDLISGRPDIAADLFPESANFKAGHDYCVITDFKMGDINGLHILKAIRCGETRVPPNTPVILLTGFSDDFVVSTALQLDVNAFVLKPVSHRTLWEKIQRVLKSVSPVKDKAVYQKVEIPNDEGEIGTVKGQSNPDVIAGDAGDVHRIPLGAVIPGAVLARDLHGARGALLLREGTVLTLSVIQKLQDLDQMKGLAPMASP
ncbi:MAG: response regulator, partial [Rhodospirillaceae bacterium]